MSGRAGPFFLLFAAVATVLAAPVPKPDELIQIEAGLTASDDHSGVVHLQGTLLAGWHINSHKPTEDYLIATSASLDPVDGLKAGEPTYPEGKLKKFSFADKPLSVYEDRFTVDIPVSSSATLPGALSGTLHFQACNDTQCLPPGSVRFEAKKGAASAAGPVGGGAVPLAQAPAASTSAPGASNDFGDLLARRGLAVALLIVFGWGLALNLTPCVYPVIPLTIGFFGGQTPGNSGRTFRLASLYVLGMATMYSALGVIAALSGRLFGVALQSPWVLGGIAAVLVLLALSMFGLYDIRMPTGLTQKAGARAGAAGAYGMGLLVGVVAAPCIGPVVLALLAFVAARGDAAFGFLIFFVLSLGLGLPYLFLGVFSGSLSRLPRAGMWMEDVKKIFGWLLLAMSAYFLRTILPRPIGPWLLPAVLFLGAVMLAFGKARLGRAPRWIAAAVLLAAGLFFLPRSAPSSTASLWMPFSGDALSRAGRPVIIDFSADWCVPCRELDEKTFSDERVLRELRRRALLKADLTQARSPDALSLTERYAILGVPTIVFLDASGKERTDLRLVGFEGPDQFLERLAKAP
ncbi:MAG TPA: cytochrome c biogenesis protein CcdA [Thermoanaerobaculia bacterium]